MTAKNEPLRFFLGANTPQGFVSRFDQLGDPEEGWRCYVLKGGPGCGKSTLMKDLARRAFPAEPQTELIYCCSDSSSLDAVILPRHRTAVADGTPPHTIEPRFPGAYEVTVPLSLCWEDDLLYARRKKIMALSQKAAAAHEYSDRFLAAAGALLGDTYRMALEVTDKAKISRYAAAFAGRELGRPKHPCPGEKIRFLSAVTDRGSVLFEETAALLAQRIIFVEDEWGAASRLLLEALRKEALRLGFQVVSCYCPLSPFDKLEHLFIPEAGVGLMTANRFHHLTLTPLRTIHARRFCDAESLKNRRRRVAFNARAAAQMLEQAGRLLAEAKETHDRLEECYRQAVDYAKVEEAGRRLTEKILGTEL